MLHTFGLKLEIGKEKVEKSESEFIRYIEILKAISYIGFVIP